MKFVLFLCLVLFQFNFIFAGDIQTFTLEQATNSALKKNPDILQAAKDVQVAEFQLSESYADLFMPSISASGSFSYQDPDSVNRSLQSLDIGGKTYVITNNFPDNYSAGLSVSKPIFQGFKYWNAKETQKLNLDLVRLKYKDTVQSVIYSITTNFYNLSLAEQNLSINQMADKNLKTRLDYVSESYKRGITNEVDYLKALYAYKNNIPVLIKSQNDYDASFLNMCLLIGITNTNGIEFLGNYRNLSNIILSGEAEPLMLAKAYSNDLTLKTTEITIATTKLSQSTTGWSKFPTLTGGFNYNYNYRKDNSAAVGSTMNERVWQPSWQASINLNIPIDSWIPVSRTALTIGENEKTLEKLSITSSQRIEVIKQQFTTLLKQLNELATAVESQQANKNLAQKTYELTREQFKRGTVISLDLNDNDLTYRQAEYNYWQAFYNYAIVVLKLKTMMGE